MKKRLYQKSHHHGSMAIKSVGNLISRKALPNKTDGKWKLHPVEVLDKVDDYQKARKKAEDNDSESSEKGRGKRKKKPTKVLDNTEELLSSEDEISQKVVAGVGPDYPCNFSDEGISMSEFKPKLQVISTSVIAQDCFVKNNQYA